MHESILVYVFKYVNVNVYLCEEIFRTCEVKLESNNNKKRNTYNYKSINLCRRAANENVENII